MKLGFFGGSFNPPTIAHYNLIKQALIEYKFDKVYFVPVNNFYPKSDLIDITHRINMLSKMCQNDENIEVSKIEKDVQKQFKAIDIFKLIEENFKNDKIFFFMGEDNFKKLPMWKDYETLKNYNYVVFQRDEKYDSEISKENIIYMKNNENLKISSTIIRNKLKNNESVDDLITKDVKEYILKNKLYI